MGCNGPWLSVHGGLGLKLLKRGDGGLGSGFCHIPDQVRTLSREPGNRVSSLNMEVMARQVKFRANKTRSRLSRAMAENFAAHSIMKKTTKKNIKKQTKRKCREKELLTISVVRPVILIKVNPKQKGTQVFTTIINGN